MDVKSCATFWWMFRLNRERNKTEKEMYAIRQQHRARRAADWASELSFPIFSFAWALVFAFWGSFQILSNKSRLNESFSAACLWCYKLITDWGVIIVVVVSIEHTKMSNIFFLDLSSPTNFHPPRRVTLLRRRFFEVIATDSTEKFLSRHIIWSW